MINCIALDDEPIAIEIIQAFCDQIPEINLMQTFTQASAAERYLAKFPVDLIFLDIQMPDINGISFYKMLKQDTMVIFTTAFSEYAVEGFNVDAVDYLLKPIEQDRFKQACQKGIDYAEFLKSNHSKSQNSLFVRSDYSLMKIPYDEIIYCETMDDYVKIHRTDNTKVLALMSLNKLLEKLPENEFVRVHRSYVVSLSKIDLVRGKKIKIGEDEIPVGVTYRNDFMQRYES
nr:LytTR family DNA-binding domain-containing protein [uncultured Carboxylicivirga sp.]